jgi:hypothetical protein
MAQSIPQIKNHKKENTKGTSAMFAKGYENSKKMKGYKKLCLFNAFIAALEFLK